MLQESFLWIPCTAAAASWGLPNNSRTFIGAARSPSQRGAMRLEQEAHPRLQRTAEICFNCWPQKSTPLSGQATFKQPLLHLIFCQHSVRRALSNSARRARTRNTMWEQRTNIFCSREHNACGKLSQQAQMPPRLSSPGWLVRYAAVLEHALALKLLREPQGPASHAGGSHSWPRP